MFDIRIEELPTYQLGMEKGIKKGRAIGAKNELIFCILLFLEKVLHATSLELERVKQILFSPSVATLRELYEELFEFQNLVEFWQYIDQIQND